MALYLVLLSAVLAFSPASTEQYVSSPGSNIDLSLRSHENFSGHWNITGEPRLLSVNVQQGTSNETEKLGSVYPSLNDTSMSGAVKSTDASTTTTTTTTSTNANTSSTTTTTTTTTTTPDTTIITTTTTTIITKAKPKSCPKSGYQLFAEFNCYKIFAGGDRTTWSEARAQCVRDGGDLMVAETEQERKEVFIPLYNSRRWDFAPWAGVYSPQGGDGWIAVTGEPAVSAWWNPGEPDDSPDRKCTEALPTGLLRNYNCVFQKGFICEISL